MDIYHFDAETGEYRGMDVADESPLEPGIFMIPANATNATPPVFEPGYARIFDGGEWMLVEDHRGEVLFDADGNEIEITELGPVDADLSFELPKKSPNVLRAEKRAALRAAREDAIRQINADVEAVRSLLLTPGQGQAMVYEMKRQEAEDFIDAREDGDEILEADFPMLFARAARMNLSPQDVADEWKERADEWHGFVVGLEDIREDAKEAVATARKVEKIEAVVEGLQWLRDIASKEASLSGFQQKVHLRKHLKKR